MPPLDDLVWIPVISLTLQLVDTVAALTPLLVTALQKWRWGK
ncbi:hypothetical protein [Streptomyces sp. NPDC026092]